MHTLHNKLASGVIFKSFQVNLESGYRHDELVQNDAKFKFSLT